MLQKQRFRAELNRNLSAKEEKHIYVHDRQRYAK